MESTLLATILMTVILLFSAVSGAEPGDHFYVSPENMPQPNSTFPDSIDPKFVQPPLNFVPEVPPGFEISVFASSPDLTHVRWIKVAPNGDVFLAEQGPGKITLMRDADGDGKAEFVNTFASGFAHPHGMAFRIGWIYVADVRAIWRHPYRDGANMAVSNFSRVTSAPDLRPEGWHRTREIIFDSKGMLYLSMGSRSDLSDNNPALEASIQKVASDGSQQTFASGLRNVVGMALQPGTDTLWATVNERDKLGAALPPDYLASVSHGDFFGWPYAYVGDHPDPEFGSKRPDLVKITKTPEVLFEAHSAPLGIVFYQADQFPADYRGDVFVALHGSGPYDAPNGYKVVRVKFENGKPVGGYEDFVTGFSDGLVPRPSVWGTPAGLAVAKDGSLLIADDKGRTVWRVTYTGKQ